MSDSGETNRGRARQRRRDPSGVTARRLVRLLIATMALGGMALLMSACGSGAASGAVSSAAQNANQAVSSAAAQVNSATASVTKTQTSTAPAKTKTETKTAPAKTHTATKSVTGPGASISVQQSTSVNALAVNGTPTTTDSSGGGLAWWAWVLIGAGVVTVLIAIFAAGRRRGRDSNTPSGPVAPGTAPAGPPGA
jgi:hypothetical protein